MHGFVKYKFLLILYLLLSDFTTAFGSNILYAAAVASPSHHIWNRALAFELANRGHNVTHIGPDQDDVTKPLNYSHILLEGVYEGMNDDFDVHEMASYSALAMVIESENWFISQCSFSLKSNGLKELLNYPSDFKFDAIILDVTAGACFYPLIQRFKYPPTVGVTPFLLPSYVSYNFGKQLSPVYIPWYCLPYSSEMSFIERVWNFVLTYADVALRYKRQYLEEYKEAVKVFGPNVPPMENLERHISLILANTDPILDHSHLLPPNIIPVGGLHTKKSNILSENLKQVVEEARNGIILFSLGTNIRSEKLKGHVQNAFLEAFRDLSQIVIWKYDGEINDLPKNVILKKWIPQNDILGHPNVKLLIGHGGALSTQEGMFHGVPMVLIPFLDDQHSNTKIVIKKGVGVSIDFKRITAGYVLSKIREVLDNNKYTENAKNISNIFKARAETPLQRGIFWIEYVIRFKGADFLNIPLRDFPFYKSSGLDVIVFLILIMVTLLTLLYKIFSFLLFHCFRREKLKQQ
ncbi:UDP-glycosyltransferase UGT5-like [Tenebrio molitor]|uniref:UDP-glycosyltransferase UGT5-like n=1 Tax=Tenebrio molitor TaxID=7067 RepID=UPI0036249728